MQLDPHEEKLLRSVALQNARAVLHARERAERELFVTKDVLHKTNQEVVDILESISDGFFALDAEWRFTYVNRKAAEIFSPLAKEENGLLGKIIWIEFPAAAGTEIEDNCRRAVREHKTVEFETYFQPLNSWFILRAYPSARGLSVYFQDITERKNREAGQKQADEHLRASEERFRATFSQAAVGMAIAGMDARFEQVNARFASFLGYSMQEMQELTFLDISHPDELSKTRENVRLLTGGEIEQYVLEKRYVRKDGAVVWGLTSVTLLRSATGEPERFVGVIEDITTRKETEEALRRGAERLQLAFSAGRLGDWSWDARTDIVSVGKEAGRIFRLPSTAPITWESLRARFHPDDRERARLTVESALNSRSAYDLEYRIATEDGLKWIASSGRGIYDADGSVLGMIGVVQDVTDRKAADEMRSRLAAVVESSDDAILTMGLDTVITTWNRGAELMFGYRAEEIVGTSVIRLLPPGRKDEEPQILERLIRGERVEHYETVRIRKDGSLIDVSLTVSPIFDATGKMIGASKISRDISERKEAEARLRRSEEELRALANSIPQLAWMAHPNGDIFWYNQRWCEYTGRTPSEMEGWGWKSVHDPAILPEVLKRWQESLDNGQRFEMEFPLRGADGTYRWFLTQVEPFRDPNGEILRWFGTNTDVEEVRRAQKALQEESRVLEILNETGKAIASRLDLKEVVQIVTDSATRLTGAKFGAFFYNVINQDGEAFMLYTLSGAPREAFEKFGHPRATPLFGPTFRGEPPVRCADVMKDPRYGKMAPHHGMPKGHLPVRSYLAVPVFSRTGDVIGGLFFGHPEPNVFSERDERLIVGVAAQAAIAIDNANLYDGAQREIARRRQVESELRAAQEKLQSHALDLETLVAERTAKLRETIGELEAFSYSVSHDMRSPLRAMQGYSDALLDEYSGKLDDTAQDYLNRIKRAANRMDLLIQDVLAYSRVAQGDIQLKTVDLEGIIRDVIDNYPSLQSQRAKIKIHGPLPRVVGHEAYLTQVVSNILTNGVKFVAAGVFPQIEISSSKEGEDVRIYFKDNGIGIAPEHLQRVFQIFGRVYSEKQYEGTGIGLAIAKKAVERMGASIGLTSEVGKGSCFFVNLKAAK